jgi:hypothetical protein
VTRALPRPTAAIGIVLAGVLWGVVALIAFYSTRLRPVADDYCHGAAATAGYFPSIVNWYLTWVGDIFQVAMTSLFVGQPLAHLPFAIASAIPFIATALTVVLLMVLAVGRIQSPSRKTAILVGAVLIPLALVVWWGYWWVTASLTDDRASISWMLATATLHWQVVNVQYTLVPAILIAAYLALTRRPISRTWLKVVLFALLGLCAGLGGLAFGAAAFAFVILVAAATAIRARTFAWRAQLANIVLAAFCFAGLLISYFAPGTAVRSIALAPDLPLDSITPWRLFAWMFPQSVFTWLSEIAHGGTVAAALVAVGAGACLRAVGARIDRGHLIRIGAGLLGMSLLVTLAFRGAEAFSYATYWHEVTPRTLILVSVVLLGLGGGDALAARLPAWGRPALAIVSVLALLVVLGSLFTLQYEIIDRYAEWIAGPAPSGIADINSEWVRNCWDQLADYRDVPARGL